MEQLATWVSTNIWWLVLLMAGFQLFLGGGLLVCWRQVRGIQPYRRLARGLKDSPVEMVLHDYLEGVRGAMERVDQVETACKKVEYLAGKSLQKVGLVRFNAFEDMGSNLSFALALLDSHDDGVVITSILGRDESRLYAKPLRKGKSTYHLSREEEEAIRQAVSGNK